jgi:metal-dependent HD superfamily phosphatase/phosphodiesterase
MEMCEEGYVVAVRQVKVYDLKANPKLLLAFLNNALRNSMRHLNYVEIGRTGKYFNAKEKKNIDNLVMYNGFKSNFVQLEKGIFLRVDAAKKIVRNQTVLEFIDQLYGIHRDKDKDERRMLLKEKLVGQSVMSNYGKTVYHRVMDIRFEDMSTINVPTPEANLTLIQYYKVKYGITINKPKQPLVVAEGRKKGEEILLVPELLLMTGIPEDFDDFRRKQIS